jgi:hypothetical protein
VADYLKFSPIGTTTVRKIAPHLQIQMAGGLWPRNFRADLLKAGIGQYVDVLPYTLLAIWAACWTLAPTWTPSG